MAPVDRNSPRRAKTSESTYTIMDFVRDFPDDATCLDYLWRRNFSEDGTHAHCPKCSQTRRFHRVTSRPSYSCDSCGHHLHPTAETIFHKSSTSLHLWFHAIFLMSSTRCGISAKQLERELGVTYKTAWRMFHLIRNELMAQDDGPLSGEVEMDETYVGGKRRTGRTGRPGRDESKQPVFGMVERGGRVRAIHVESASAASLMPHVIKYVVPDAVVYTDEWGAYKTVERQGYEHRTIRHNDGVYVMGDIHTNTIEGFWALVKRGLSGTHHMVSAKHLQGYLNEYAWRYNHRKDEYPTFLTLLGNV
jgi:transposase-like protein